MHPKEAPGEEFCIDFCGPFPATEQGFKYVLVIIDSFSSYVLYKPMTSKTHLELVRTLWSDWICPYGRPRGIRSDNELTSEMMEEMCKSLHIAHRRGPPHQPTTNSQTERAFGTLKALLWATARGLHPYHWNLFLPSIAHAMNITASATTHITPQKLFFGREASHPLEDLVGSPVAEQLAWHA